MSFAITTPNYVKLPSESVLNVSVDGDITIFRSGAAITTLLGRGAESTR